MPEHDEHDHLDGGYAGPATIVVDGHEVTAEVRLTSHHEPVDGRLHWAGRVQAQPRLAALAGTGADVRVHIGDHTATGRLGDPDLWDRYRLTGVGRPPFPLDVASGDPVV